MKKLLLLFGKTLMYACSNFMWEIIMYYMLLFIFIVGCFYPGIQKTATGVFIVILFIVAFKIIKRIFLSAGDYSVRKYEQRRREKLRELYQYLMGQ